MTKHRDWKELFGETQRNRESDKKRGWKTNDEGWTLEVAKVIQVYVLLQTKGDRNLWLIKNKNSLENQNIEEEVRNELFKHEICINEKKQGIEAWQFPKNEKNTEGCLISFHFFTFSTFHTFMIIQAFVKDCKTLLSRKVIEARQIIKKLQVKYRRHD